MSKSVRVLVVTGRASRQRDRRRPEPGAAAQSLPKWLYLCYDRWPARLKQIRPGRGGMPPRPPARRAEPNRLATPGPPAQSRGADKSKRAVVAGCAEGGGAAAGGGRARLGPSRESCKDPRLGRSLALPPRRRRVKRHEW